MTVIKRRERLEGGVLLRGVPDVGHRRQHVVLPRQPVVPAAAVETAHRIGALGVELRIGFETVQKPEQPDLHFVRLVAAAHLGEPVELVTHRNRVGKHDHRILIAFLQLAEVSLSAESHVLLVETVVSLVIGRQHVAGHRPAVDRIQHPLRLDGHARRRVEFRQADSRKTALAAVAQTARQQDIALHVADGRVEFVLVEFAEQPVVDLVLLRGSQAAHAQQMPQFGDTLLLLAVVNLPVGDHVVQFVRQRLRFVPLAGGRHDRYGAEQQQGSQQVCGFQQFHGRGRPPQEASANRAKVQLFAECRLSF